MSSPGNAADRGTKSTTPGGVKAFIVGGSTAVTPGTGFPATGAVTLGSGTRRGPAVQHWRCHALLLGAAIVNNGAAPLPTRAQEVVDRVCRWNWGQCTPIAQMSPCGGSHGWGCHGVCAVPSAFCTRGSEVPPLRQSPERGLIAFTTALRAPALEGMPSG